MGKYDGLRELLARAGDRSVELSFDQIAGTVGGLPRSAYDHQAWWGNHAGNSQAQGWMPSGRRVDSVSLTRRRVRFTAPTHSQAVPPDAAADPGSYQAIPPPVSVSPPIPVEPPQWTAVWDQLARTVQAHIDAGRGHLVTEDVVRFATAVALEAAGVDPSRIRFEHRVPAISASLDLVIDVPPTSVVELKYPRDPRQAGAADTMTYGELLRDFYRLAWLDTSYAWALHLMDRRLARYLAARREIRWTWTPGETLTIERNAATALPATAARILPVWTAGLRVAATCELAHRVDMLTLAAYRVRLI